MNAPTFRLTMHPAGDGDCLVLTWGTSQLHHLIVDLGRTATYESIRPQIAGLDNVELFVMSHVDADHIAGSMPMVREPHPPFQPKRVWFNAREQLLASIDRSRSIEPFSTRQGDKLSRGIVAFNWPWNAEFASEIVSTDSPEAAAPIAIADGLTIRLLSPTDIGLQALLPKWAATTTAAHARPADPDPDDTPPSTRFESLGLGPDVARLAAERYVSDDTEPNGSSIAFIAEFAGRRVLLAADAHAEVLEAAIAPLAAAEGGRYRIDLIKVGHHGSRANTSPDLLRLVDCTRFAFSTNGDRHGHPDPQAVARLLVADRERAKTLYFNYCQPSTTIWKADKLRALWNYDCVMPCGDTQAAANGTQMIEI